MKIIFLNNISTHSVAWVVRLILIFSTFNSANAHTTTAFCIEPDTIQLAICAGEKVDDFVLLQDTVLIDTFFNNLICDSILVRQIEVLPTYEIYNSVEICEYVDQLNISVSERSDIFSDTLQTVFGCDSIVHTELIINYHTTELQYQTICPMDTFFVGNTAYTEQGLYVDTLKTYQKCDSIIVTFLAVSNPIFETQLIEICENELYNNQFFLQDTVLIDTVKHLDDCPKVIYSLIQVNPVKNTSINIQIQEGDLYNDTLLQSDTVFIDSLLTIHGCDSIVKINIQLLPRFFSNEEILLCPGESYNNTAFHENTILIDTLQSQLGTDSIIHTFIEILSIDTTWLYLDTCVPSEVGFFEEKHRNQFGCDSIILIERTLLPSQQTEQQLQFCPNTIYNGVQLRQDTTFVETHIAINGCDSLHITHVTLFSTPDVNIESEPIFCAGDSINLSIDDFENCIWSTGEMSNIINISTGGIYQVTITDSNSCTVVNQIIVPAPIDLQVQIDIDRMNCTGLDAKLSIPLVTGGLAPYLFALADENYQSTPLFEQLSAGEHRLLVEDVNGCQLDTLVNVPILTPQELIIEQDLEIQLGTDHQIKTKTNIQNINQIIWSPSTGLSCDDCLDPIAMPLVSTFYELTIFTDTGCIFRDQIELCVDESVGIFIPNAFSPNGDGHNDSFTIYADKNVHKVLSLSIYDRWGNKIFENRNFAPNNRLEGWKGDIQNSKNNNNTYVYKAKIELINNKIIFINGDITLVQ